MGGHHVRLCGADVPGRCPRPHLPDPESGKGGAGSRLVGPGSGSVTPLVKWLCAPSHPDPSAFPARTDPEVGTPQNRSAPKPQGPPAHKPTNWPLEAGAWPASGLRTMERLSLIRFSLLEEARFLPNLFASVCLFCLFKESFKDRRSVVSDCELTAWGAWPASCPEVARTFPDTISHSFRSAPTHKLALCWQIIPHTVVL